MAVVCLWQQDNGPLLNLILFGAKSDVREYEVLGVITPMSCFRVSLLSSHFLWQVPKAQPFHQKYTSDMGHFLMGGTCRNYRANLQGWFAPFMSNTCTIHHWRLKIEGWFRSKSNINCQQISQLKTKFSWEARVQCISEYAYKGQAYNHFYSIMWFTSYTLTFTFVSMLAVSKLEAFKKQVIVL